MLRRAARIAKRSGAGRAARRARAARRRAGRRAPVGALAGLRRAGRGRRRVLPHRGRRRATCPTALLEFARGANATQLVLGTSRRSRLARLFDEGIGARVVQDSGHIDVHMVTHAEAGPRAAAAARSAQRRVSLAAPGRSAGRWRVLLPAAGDRASGVAGRELLGLSTDVVLFFLATVVVALVGGLGPGAAGRAWPAGCCSTSSSPRRCTPSPSPSARTSITAGRRWCSSRCWSRWSSTGRPGAREQAARGPRRGRAAGLVLPHRAHPHRPAAAAAGEGPGGVRADRGGAPAANGSDRATAGGRRRASGRRGCARPEEADVDVAVEADLHLVGIGPHPGRRRPAAAGGRRRPGAAGAAQPARRRRGRRGPPPGRGHRACAPRCSRPSATTCARPLTSIKAAAGSLRDPDLPLSDARPHRAGRHRRGVRRPAHRAGRQPARLLPARRRRRRPAAARRSATTRSRRGRCAGSTGRAGSRSSIDEALPDVARRPRAAGTGDRQRRRQRAAPRRRRAGRAAGQRARRPRRAAGRRRGPGRAPRGAPSGCSPRSSGSATGRATATRTASGSGSASPAGSPRRWAAR